MCITNTARMELLKRNALAMAEQHKQSCNDPCCNVSIHLIEELIAVAEKAVQQSKPIPTYRGNR